MQVEDFDDFMAEPHSARKAVHCCITAHHLLLGLPSGFNRDQCRIHWEVISDLDVD